MYKPELKVLVAIPTLFKSVWIGELVKKIVSSNIRSEGFDIHLDLEIYDNREGVDEECDMPLKTLNEILSGSDGINNQVRASVVNTNGENYNQSLFRAIDKAKDYELLFMLNDDIELPNSFIASMATRYVEKKYWGVLCPVNADKPFNLYNNTSLLGPMHKREGWAMCINTDIFRINKIPRFDPLEITTFCGDDWLWKISHRIGYYWYKNPYVGITHHTSTTVKVAKKERLLKTEKEKFAKFWEKNVIV